MQIHIRVYLRTKTFFITIQPKNAYKLEFADHLWLLFLDQSQFEIVAFAIINFYIYNILSTKWKHGIGPNDIIKLSEYYNIFQHQL